MSNVPPHSPLTSAGVCLRILRRLLDDESTILAQLSYVVENIHNPILENCGPAYTKLLPVVPPVMPQSALHILSQRAANVPSLLDDATQTKANPPAAVNSGGGSPHSSSPPALTLLPPQPAIVQRPSPSSSPAVKNATSQGGSNKQAHAQARKAAAGGNRNGATTNTNAAQTTSRVLTFTQYWELFSNLPSLYATQRALVQSLENAVRDVTALLDRLQVDREREELDNSEASTGNASADEGGKTSDPPPIPLAPTSTAAQSITGCDAHEALGDTICAFFGAAEMTRYVAEHTMYTVNYTSKAAPRVLEIGRLWRRGGGGAPVFGAAAPLSSSERDMLHQYSHFLDFLLRSFGSSGTPNDCRFAIASLPHLPLERGQAAAAGSAFEGGNATSATAASAAASAAAAAAAAAAGGVGTVRGQMTMEAHASGTVGGRAGDGVGGTAAGHTATGNVSAANAKKHHGGASPPQVPLPPLPRNWKGFHTLLVLLSTPLSSLRRLLHVARCIVESHAIPREARQELQTTFITTADAQVIEEGILTMEELAQHDVRTIMSLIDDSSSATIVGADGTTAGEGGASLLSQFRNPSSPRVLVHYGRLYKRSGRGKHERLMFLFTDWICYVEELSSGRMRLRGAMPLDTLRVIDVADAPAVDVVNCFELINAQTKRFIFFVSTPEQKRQWVDAVCFAVRQLSRSCLRAKLAATNASNHSSMALMTTAAVAASVFQNMKPITTSTPLAHNSRLCRQRRDDQAWQEYLDAQNATQPSRLHSPHLSLVTSGTRADRSQAAAPDTPAPPHAATDSFALLQASQSGRSLGGGGGGGPSGSHHSRSSSHIQARNLTPQRQLQYDVTPWSRQSATHRRLRSGPEVHLSATAVGPGGFCSSSRQSSLSSLEGGEKGEEGGVPAHRTGPGHSHQDADNNDGGRPSEPQDPCDAERGTPGGASATAAADDPLRSFRHLPGATSPCVSNIPRQPSRTESLGGASSSSRPPIPSTPQRRPVSERFEVAQSSPTSTPGRLQRANSLPSPSAASQNANGSSSPKGASSKAAVPPRPPSQPSPGSFPRARRGSPPDSLKFSASAPDKFDRDAPPPVDSADGPLSMERQGAAAGEGADDVDSQLSSLMRERHEETALPEREAPDCHSSCSNVDHPHSSSDDNEEEEDVPADHTGSVSLTEDLVGCGAGAGGDPTPSEDAADLPPGAQLRAIVASPTGLDEEERVTAALTAFRPHDTTTLSDLSFSPERTHPLRPPTAARSASATGFALGSGTRVGGGVAVLSEDPRLPISAARAAAKPVRAQQMPSRYMDPSADLEAIYQQDEAREAQEAKDGARDHSDIEGTNDSNATFDEAEKQDLGELVGIPDTDLDLSEGEVERQEKESPLRKTS